MKSNILSCFFLVFLLTGCGNDSDRLEAERRETERGVERRAAADRIRAAESQKQFWRTAALVLLGVAVVVLTIKFGAANKETAVNREPNGSNPPMAVVVKGTSAEPDSEPPMQPIRQPVTTHSPYQKSQAPNGILGSYVIDGLNVCFNFDLSQPPSLAVLTSTLIAIHKRGGAFICFFDASAPHHFREKNGLDIERAYKSLCKALPHCFVQVPAGTTADDYLLNHADRNNLAVISNDRFEQDEYVQRYPWLADDRTRRITGLVVGGNVVIPTLSISVPLERDVDLSVNKLVEMMTQHTSKTLQEG